MVHNSKELVESILTGDMVSAKKLFESRLDQIVERKLYEKKKMIQAEVFGGMTPKEIEDRKKAGYKKASEVLGDPSKKDLKSLGHEFKKVKRKVSEEILDEYSNLQSLYRQGLQTGAPEAQLLQRFRRGYRSGAKGTPGRSVGTQSNDSNMELLRKTNIYKKAAPVGNALVGGLADIGKKLEP